MRDEHFNAGDQSVAIIRTRRIHKVFTQEGAERLLRIAARQRGMSYVRGLAAGHWASSSEKSDDDTIAIVGKMLVRGQLSVIESEREFRLFREPDIVDLSSLSDIEGDVSTPVDVPKPSFWVEVRVVDQAGRPLPFFDVEIDRITEPLDSNAAAKFAELRDDSEQTATLTVRDVAPTGA